MYTLLAAAAGAEIAAAAGSAVAWYSPLPANNLSSCKCVWWQQTQDLL
jgi:hypothetical protein